MLLLGYEQTTLRSWTSPLLASYYTLTVHAFYTLINLQVVDLDGLVRRCCNHRPLTHRLWDAGGRATMLSDFPGFRTHYCTTLCPANTLDPLVLVQCRRRAFHCSVPPSQWALDRERLQNLPLRLSFLPSGPNAIHPSPSPLASHAPGPSVCESVFQSRGESGSLSATSSLTFLPSSPPPTLFFPSLSLFSSLAHLLAVSRWPLPSPLLLFLTLQLFLPDLFSPLFFSVSW